MATTVRKSITSAWQAVATAGDVIELRGTPHASEAMRIDYLDFALV